MIIESCGTKKSFCHQCQSAKKVVELKIAACENSFLICEKCLDELSNIARNGDELINLHKLVD
jgi:hypothetical protein